jgi:hypothetical protein
MLQAPPLPSPVWRPSATRQLMPTGNRTVFRALSENTTALKCPQIAQNDFRILPTAYPYLTRLESILTHSRGIALYEGGDKGYLKFPVPDWK